MPTLVAAETVASQTAAVQGAAVMTEANAKPHGAAPVADQAAEDPQDPPVDTVAMVEVMDHLAAKAQATKAQAKAEEAYLTQGATRWSTTKLTVVS